jgi:hypothetical protein
MKAKSLLRCAFALAALAIATLGDRALAQAPARSPSVEQLQAEIERRDNLIADLLQRVQALEQRLGVAAPPPTSPTPTPPAAPGARAAAEEAAEEALLERALERSLVLAGGATLPRGQREIEPSIFYDYTQRSGLAAFDLGVVSRSFRRENVGAGLTFRAGLPWTSQLDVSVPFVHQRIEAVVDSATSSSSTSGIGDIQVALTKQFLAEPGARFGLLGGVGWVHARNNAALEPIVFGLPDFATPAAIGAGHDSFVARVAATKRMDPLVFVGSYSHGWNRSESVAGASVRAGDADSVSLRAILAASPEVSLRSGLSFTRTDNTRVNGVTLGGTRATATVLELGTSVVMNRNRLLDIAIGVGLTADAPDFSVSVSMPIRF